MSWLIFFMTICFPAMWAFSWAERQCTRLDVETGRRDAGALYDDYGSNRGWYWRYKIISIPAALLAAPGLLAWAMFALVWIASGGR